MASLVPNKKVEPSDKKTDGKPIWILTLNQIMYVHNKWPQIDLVYKPMHTPEMFGFLDNFNMHRYVYIYIKI